MTHPNRVRLSKLTLGLLAVLATAPVFAQSTSAGVGGRVVGADGQAVAGAEVVITHAESGTVSRATTDAEGRYNARGLRVGGPYTITINKPGAGSETRENVFLALNQVSEVDAQLSTGVTTLEAVQAVATVGSDVFSATKMGAGSNVTREKIEALPSIARDIQDYVRTDPRIVQTDKERGEISAGGQNTRYNVIRIDGVNASDPFGLEANNYPTLRQPVSIDAIQEVNIDLSNYDTTVTGGTGAVINSVTKSGTNEFHGSVYYIYRDGDWVRKTDDRGFDFNGFIDEKTYGATFGGPLVKDRLFFFANYEKFTRSRPGVDIGSSPLGRGTITDADIAEAQRIARETWGFDAGNLDGSALTNEVEEYALRLDWNITDTQRAYFRYSKFDQVDANTVNFGGSNVSLNSFWYNHNKVFESYVGQLFSDWTDNFSTEAKISYREYSAIRNPLSRLPSIQIKFGNDNLYFGTDQFSHRNELKTEQWSGLLSGTLFAGDHEIKFGADYETNDVFNLFGRDLFGVYTFDSLADFEAGTSSFYTSRAPQAGQSVESIAANFTMANLGVFAQDTWTVNNNLNIMFGLRYDVPQIDDKPQHNARIQTLYGYDNSQTVDGNGLFQPRLGFNYTFDSDRQTQLRGGVGLFQGAAATVWMANPFSNTGFNFVQYQASNGIDEFSPDPDNQPTPASAPPRLAVDLIDPDLHQPSVWKANLAFDHELPWWGTVFGIEALVTRVNEGIYYQRLDLCNGAGQCATDVGMDGRSMFWNNGGYNPANFGTFTPDGDSFDYNPAGTNRSAGSRANRPSDIGDVMIARPTKKGGGQQLTVSLSKPMTDAWSWTLAYTLTEATEVNPLTSSQATSNWNNNMIFNANEEVASRSNYAIRDRVTAELAWQHNFFGDYRTKVSAFYEGRSGRPYSWTYWNDANGDSRINDLLYVPAGPGDVIFRDVFDPNGALVSSGVEQEAAFWEFVNSNPDLARYKGQVVDRNSADSSWTNNIDLRISQELPGFFGDNKAEIWLDVLNLGNLLNKDWGHVDEIGFPQDRSVVYYHGIDPATGKYVYYFNNAEAESRRDTISRWALQVGFRYKF
ncbi:MAG TPA: carboxypeptidase regulatory-like domain-containing protein [Lysobacter sp.]